MGLELLIPVVILAAGMSTRFPGNKLLYSVEGKPLIRYSVESALSSKADEVVVVLGHEVDKIASEIKDLDVVIVYNPNYKIGMSESVKKGVRAVYKWAEAVIIHPADVAFAPPQAFNAVIDGYRSSSRADIVVVAFKGRRGHPILFSKNTFNDILSTSEETMGLKYVTRKYATSTRVIDVPFREVIVDIDTIEDLRALGKI